MFYPDYIVGVRDNIWIIETKGGFSDSGESQDIDVYSPKKFAALKEYLQQFNLKGGFVRQDKHSQELCICTEIYSDDINSASWKLLNDAI